MQRTHMSVGRFSYKLLTVICHRYKISINNNIILIQHNKFQVSDRLIGYKFLYPIKMNICSKTTTFELDNKSIYSLLYIG